MPGQVMSKMLVQSFLEEIIIFCCPLCSFHWLYMSYTALRCPHRSSVVLLCYASWKFTKFHTGWKQDRQKALSISICVSVKHIWGCRLTFSLNLRFGCLINIWSFFTCQYILLVNKHQLLNQRRGKPGATHGFSSLTPAVLIELYTHYKTEEKKAQMQKSALRAGESSDVPRQLNTPNLWFAVSSWSLCWHSSKSWCVWAMRSRPSNHPQLNIKAKSLHTLHTELKTVIKAYTRQGTALKTEDQTCRVKAVVRV